LLKGKILNERTFKLGMWIKFSAWTLPIWLFADLAEIYIDKDWIVKKRHLALKGWWR
jgi:hypothetical protein